MEINRDEKWLGKLKDSLGNWQEPAPADFWSNLERDIPQAAGKGRPARYLYWTAAAAAAILAAFLFVPQQERALAPAPGTETAQNVTMPVPVADPGTEKVQNVTVPVPEANLGTKPAQNVPASVPVANPDTKTAQNVTVPVPVADQGAKTAQDVQEQADVQMQLQQQQQPEQKPHREAEQEPRREAEQEPHREAGKEAVKEAVREALYLAEEKRAGRKWMAFSAGNGAFSMAPGMGGDNAYAPVSGHQTSASPGQGTSGIPAVDIQQDHIFGFANLDAVENSRVSMVGGSNFHSFRGKEVYRSYEYNHRQPVRLGVSFAFEVTRNLFLESGISYEYLGSTMKGSGETLHQHLHYLGVPLKANVYLSKSDRFSFYVGAGLLFERCVYGTVAGRKVSLNEWQKSYSGSIGAQILLGGRAYLYLEPGVSRYMGMDDEVISMQKGFVIRTLHSEEPFGVTLSGGVRILF